MATLPSGTTDLLHLNDGNGSTTITNAVSGGATWAAFGASVLSSTTPKFGATSLNNQGIGYIQRGTSVSFAGDFTLIWWGSRTQYTGKTLCIGNEGDAGAMNIETFVNNVNVITTTAGTVIGSTSAPYGQPGDGWRMAVLVRSGNTLTFAVEDSGGQVQIVGTAVVTDTFTGKITWGDKIVTGGTPEGGDGNFYYDEIAVVPGVAVYTSFPFAAPSVEYDVAAAATEVINTPASVLGHRRSTTYDFSGAGWFDVAQEVAGVFDQDMIAPALGAGALTGSPTIGAFTTAGTLAAIEALTGAPTLPAFTTAGTLALTGLLTGSPTLASFTVGGTLGAVEAITGAPTIAAFTTSGALANVESLAGSPTLGAFTTTGTLVAPEALQGAFTLPAFTTTGALAAVEALTGAFTLAAFTTSGALLGATNGLTGSPTLAAFTTSGALAAVEALTGSPTLGAVTTSGALAETVAATGTLAIGAFTTTGAIGGAPGLTGSPTLGAVTTSGAAAVTVSIPSAASTGGGTFLWDPAAKSSFVTLSNGNKTATAGGSTCSVRGDTGKTTGRWFYEVAIGSSATYALVGVGDALTDVNSYPGVDPHSVGYFALSGAKFGGTASGSSGATYGSGDIITVDFDADTGAVNFYKNGTLQGTASTLATGGTYYPMFGYGGASVDAIGTIIETPAYPVSGATQWNSATGGAPNLNVPIGNFTTSGTLSGGTNGVTGAFTLPALTTSGALVAIEALTGAPTLAAFTLTGVMAAVEALTGSPTLPEFTTSGAMLNNPGAGAWTTPVLLKFNGDTSNDNPTGPVFSLVGGGSITSGDVEYGSGALDVSTSGGVASGTAVSLAGQFSIELSCFVYTTFGGFAFSVGDDALDTNAISVRLAAGQIRLHVAAGGADVWVADSGATTYPNRTYFKLGLFRDASNLITCTLDGAVVFTYSMSGTVAGIVTVGGRYVSGTFGESVIAGIYDNFRLTDNYARYASYPYTVATTEWTLDSGGTNGVTGAFTLPGFTTSGALALLGALTGSPTLAPFTTAGALAAIESLTGSPTLAAFTTAGTLNGGTNGVTGAFTLQAFSTSGALASSMHLTGTATLDAFTTSGALALRGLLTGSPTLGAFTTSGALAALAKLTGSPTLNAFTTSGALLQVPNGLVGAPTLPPFTTAGTLAAALSVNGSVTLAQFAAAGALAAIAKASGDYTLGAFSLSGGLVHGVMRYAQGDWLLQPFTTSGYLRHPILSFRANERTYKIDAEDRRLVILAEDRVAVIDEEDRRG